jgi:hypothetical protein
MNQKKVLGWKMSRAFYCLPFRETSLFISAFRRARGGREIPVTNSNYTKSICCEIVAVRVLSRKGKLVTNIVFSVVAFLPRYD